MSSLHIIFASTSGHTEYVIDQLMTVLKKQAPALTIVKKRVESAKPEDMTVGDALLLASGTWNTGGPEGQLNPYMHIFLNGPAKAIDLKGKKVAIVALGDDRYFYTARAGEHLRNFIQSHGGTVLGEQLTIVNEPYGQEEKVKAWGRKFSEILQNES